MKADRAEAGSLPIFGKKLLLQLLILGALSLSLLFPRTAKADSYGCNTPYGSVCPTQLSVEKLVQNPITGELVQIVSGNDATFAPDSLVNFRIEVKNVGADTVTGVSVTDQLPANVSFVSANPTATLANNTLSWTIDSLAVNESRFFQVTVKVNPQSALNFTIACETNFAQAQKDQTTASSTAVFCIQAQAVESPGTTIINNNVNENNQSQSVNVNVGVGTSSGVLGVTTLPKTGLPIAFWVVSGLLPLGFKLRRFELKGKGEEGNADYIYQVRKFLKGGGEIK